MKARSAFARMILIASLFTAIAGALSAEVTVAITPPEFTSGGGFLDDSFESASDRINDEINGYLDDKWMRKPRFMRAFGAAAAYALLVPRAVPACELPALNFGVAASAWANPLDETVEDTLRETDVNSDEPMGAYARPFLLSVDIPLEWLKKGLSAGGTFGYMGMSDDLYRASSFSAGVQAGYRLFGARFGPVTWEGLSLRAGVDGSVDNVIVKYSFDKLSESVTFDEDGDGPLPPFDARARVSPDVSLEAEISSLSFSVRASTGVTLVDAISLFGGFGLTAYSGTARIGVSLDEEISLDGYAATLVRKPARVTVSGDLAKEQTSSFGGFLECALQLRAGALLITIPVLWTPYCALGTGVFMGVAL